MSSTTDELVEKYLKHLDVELDELPRARRREIVDEISGHIREARADLPADTEVGVRNILDDLGDPAEIAAEARERFGVQPQRWGFLEIAALILLLVGGFVFVVGWLIGVVLLWSSNAWNTRDKIIGTLLVPGGLALPLFLLTIFAVGGSSGSGVGRLCQIDPETGRQFNCTAPDKAASMGTSASDILAIAFLIVLLVAPIVTTAYLSHRMRRRMVAAV